jgi:GH35 family endo-1,4-beta-xylanase
MFDETPIIVWSEGYGWQRVTLAKIARLKGLLVGTEGSGWLLGNRESLKLAQEQVQIVIPTYPTINWKILQPTKDVFDAEQLRRVIRLWKSKGFQVILPGILPGQIGDLPDWLLNDNYSATELEEFITFYVLSVVNTALEEGVDTAVIISEPYLPRYRTNDYLYKRFGNNYKYVRLAILAIKSAHPDFKLIYNDTDNHAKTGLTTRLTKQILNENPEIDYVGIEGHLGDWVRFYDYSDIVSTLSGYTRSLIVTENDISLRGIDGNMSQKRLIQARAAYDFISAAKKAGATIFIFWGLDGNVSWLENALGQHDSYATMFDKNYQPMPYFYSICKAFLYDK